MRTFKFLILSFIASYCISCADGNNASVGFSIPDEGKMLEEAEVFISSVNSGNLEEEFLFREDSVLYWDYYRVGNKNYITPDISFSKIVEFDNLKCDSIHCSYNSFTGIYSHENNVVKHFTFFINQKGLIYEVLHREVINVSKFYIDQSEISSSKHKVAEFIQEAPFQWGKLGNDNLFHLKQ